MAITSSQPETLILDRLESPIGAAVIVTDDAERLRAFNWTEFEPGMRAWLVRHYPRSQLNEGQAPSKVRNGLRAYFEGELAALDTIPWQASGTAFQLSVWEALCTIPYGETLSYAGLAQRIGRPAAVRAVGSANGANPVAVVVPCHRVIGSNRLLTGYGGGLPRKRWLLAHESAFSRAIV